MPRFIHFFFPLFFLIFTCFTETIKSNQDFHHSNEDLAPCTCTTTSYTNGLNLIEEKKTFYTTEDGDQHLLTLERYQWDPDSGLLKMHILENSQGMILLSQTCFYNDEGQLIEEHYQNYEDLSSSTRHTFAYEENGNRIRTITQESKDLSQTFNTNLNLTTPDSTNSTSASVGREANKETGIFSYFEQSFREEIEFFSLVSGNHIGVTESGTFYGKKTHEKIRITFINGMLNTKKDLLKTVQWISESHGDVNIHYIFRPTEGWAWDVLKSSMVKLGIVSTEAYALAHTWKKLIAEMGGIEGGGTIVHYAHSIGGTNTYIAKSLMTPEELKLIQVITFGSATIIPSKDFQSVLNYISVRDGVALFDITEHIQAFFNEQSHVLYVGTCWGIPLADHFLFDSYRIPLENYGKAFAQRYFAP